MAKKLSKAQKRALEEISQAGGHGIGSYSYLRTRTAEILAERGLVVLGRRRYPGRDQMRWAIAAGAEEPHDFVSDAEMRRQWAVFSEQQTKLREEREAALSERVRKAREARGAPTDADWEARLAEAIEKHGIAAIEKALDAEGRTTEEDR